jgi:hypothetical protein
MAILFAMPHYQPLRHTCCECSLIKFLQANKISVACPNLELWQIMLDTFKVGNFILVCFVALTAIQERKCQQEWIQRTKKSRMAQRKEKTLTSQVIN